MRVKVDILMATHNGERFVEEQIQSLIHQSYEDWSLIIHDDGSVDRTLDIIKNLQNKDHRIKIVEDGLVFNSASRNFLHLLQFSTAPYIIFCDQDDYWLPDKIETMVSAMAPPDVPYAVYANSNLWDGRLISNTKTIKFHRSNLNNSLFLNSGVQGSSLMFSRALLEKIKPLPNYVFMHDHLFTISAVTFGKLKYIDKSLMYYRRHNRNVTQTSGNLLLSVVHFLFGGKAVLERRHFEANRSFFTSFKHDLEPKKKQLFEAYIKYATSQSVLERLSIISKHDFSIGKNRLVLIIKTILRRPLNTM